jgi:hypothetical protein
MPSEFRPIALTNCDGKLFFSIVARRMEDFMTANNYIDRSRQKGFMRGIAGCLEHSFVLSEALNNAKKNYRSICVSWIDLANAYGSVRHNLIQFALHWYHIPEQICQLIFNYYDHLCACIVTEKWQTEPINFCIGLFQGCTASTILFDICFPTPAGLLDP